jgi:C-terminal processing protease CtpA/Prc
LDLSVETVDGKWKPIPIEDPGFEINNIFANWNAGTPEASVAGLRGWNATLDSVNPASGKTALRIEPATKVLTDELFSDSPAADETVDVDLGQGLRARVPLALYSKDGHTIGDDPDMARHSQIGTQATSSEFDLLAGIADVIVVWNVLDHFWPYWSIVSIDWNAELDAALADALDDRSIDDHVATLDRLSAALPDGHADTTCDDSAPRDHLPFQVEVVEGQVVVTSSGDPNVAQGDVVVSVDGAPAAELLAAAHELVSGSAQYRLVEACERFGVGSAGSIAELRLRHYDRNIDVAVKRGKAISAEPLLAPIERFTDGVYYVDLSRAGMGDIKSSIDQLAAAPGVVFDLRGYSNGNDQVLWYLLTTPTSYTDGMAIPHVLRPNHTASSITSWKTASTPRPPQLPHIAGRVAFLVGPGTISSAESMMSIVEYYRLGEIVGSATAGTNGNIAEITAPSGCRTTFTAMRVVKRDGTQHHLVGVQPTIPVVRTLAGVSARRDEVLEKALVYVRTGDK